MHEAIVDGLPPGPASRRGIQTLGMLTHQRPFLERARRRFGPLFTVRVPGLNIVVVSDPALIKQVFTAPADVLYAGEFSPLRAVLGDNSLLAIDGERHMEQRRILLPPFKGERMRAYEGLVEEIAAEEIATWPRGKEFGVAHGMQRITLRAILRAVFGATGRDLHELEEAIPTWTTIGSAMSQFPGLQRDWGPLSPWGRFLRLRARIDAVLDRLIDEARADPDVAERVDVLALISRATHTDGSLMSHAEMRDQLVTMLAAGHETTAHTLAWSVERLRRNPDVLRRLVDEVDAGGHELRDATIREIQRSRPVLTFAGRFVMAPYEVGGHRLPIGTLIGLCAGLTHYDSSLFEHPERFDPDRFLGRLPETYSWIPFGGGRRRCIGATFAHMELDIVLRTLLRHVTLEPTTAPGERWAFRGVTFTPARGGRVRLHDRVDAPTITAPVAPREAVAA